MMSKDDKPESTAGEIRFPQKDETRWICYRPDEDESLATWRRRYVHDIEASSNLEYIWVKDDAVREAVITTATMLVSALESDRGCMATIARYHLRLIEAVQRMVARESEAGLEGRK